MGACQSANALMMQENIRAATKEKYLDPNYEIYANKFGADHVLFSEAYEHGFDRSAKIYYIVTDEGYVHRLTYEKQLPLKTQRIHYNGVVILNFKPPSYVCMFFFLSFFLFDCALVFLIVRVRLFFFCVYEFFLCLKTKPIQFEKKKLACLGTL